MFSVIRPQIQSDILQQPKIMSDINLKFKSTGIEYVYDAEVAIQSFLVLLGTPKKSRWWRPEYGAIRLESLLFEPFDEQTADEIIQAIQVTNEVSSNGNTGVFVDGIDIQLDYATSSYRVYMVVDIPRLGLKSLPVEFGLQKLGN